MAEEEAAADVDKNDLSGKSKQELVDMCAALLESEPVQTLRKSVEAIKIAFYKLHRAEVDAARKAFEAVNVGLTTLSNYDALIDVASETGYIRPEDIDVLKEWRFSPSTWGK